MQPNSFQIISESGFFLFSKYADMLCFSKGFYLCNP